MMKPVRTRTPKLKSPAQGLAQQKTDFTAEGSPPPGKVATAKPVAAEPGRRGVMSRASLALLPVRKGPAPRKPYS
ncbi:hypothetical protein [Rivibacter subsaxonicus]|uniref:Uncharacterized protein n=1 Tax=Rivibacter subsaxonicus TaxID=457575 RepID=A0A4V2FUS9_9BURK|nr:hypothetical protein [Rivibacter subsaxonicus]RZU03136.1 hypothetical protein EV670_1169 [Rivibacter subsaxonicus]